MKQKILRSRHQIRVGVAFSCIALAALTAVSRGFPGSTETAGGIAAIPLPPQPAVNLYDPETTSTFTDQQAFLDAVTCRTVSVESFEETTADNRIDQSAVMLSDVSITTNHPPQLGVWNIRYQGAFATDGSQWLGVEENSLTVPHVTTLTFGTLINNFGVNVTDYGDFGNGNLEFANDVGDAATAAFSGQPSGNHQFFGIINSARAFRTVTLTHSIEGEFFGIDEITYCWQGAPDTTEVRRPSGRRIPD